MARLFSPVPRGSAVALAGVLLVIFLFAIDATIVGTAMPTVVARLGGLELYSWVFAIYMLASALATPIFGKLADLYGCRRLMLFGIFLFTAGSVLCGLSGTMLQLVGFRALQGIGGGAVYALSLIVVGVLFPPERRAGVQGVISTIWGGAAIVGPLAGGTITQYWSWRWIFFINLPLALVAAALIVAGLKEVRGSSRSRLDIGGALALLLGLGLVFYALEESRRNLFAVDGAVLSLLAAAAGAFFIFARLESRSREPILPPELFRMRVFTASLGLTAVASMGIFGLISYLPLYIQGVLGGAASVAGSALLFANLGWTGGSFLAGQLLPRFGYRAVSLLGMASMALGYGGFVAGGHGHGLPAAWAVGALAGLGVGAVNVTAIVAAQNGVPRSRLGVATSTMMLCRICGGALGISLMGAVLFGSMQRGVEAIARDSGMELSDAVRRSLVNPQNLLEPASRAAIPEALRGSLVAVLGDSVWHAFGAAFVLTLAGLLLALLLPKAAGAQRSGSLSR
jgi:EmrB/QacA subfamily drug resistance transporter